MPTFPSMAAVEDTLAAHHPSKLERTLYTTKYIEQFLDSVGSPQDKPHAVHIAGTSGKTSTAYYCAALLQQLGKRVGLLTSPHVTNLTERVQINLQPLSESEFRSELGIFMELVDVSTIPLTYAEILYGFAFWEFVRQRVDYIVVEVGMGGLLDATNVIHSPDKMCVITDIGYDHRNVLGDTLEEIATHKAGIIQRGTRVFCNEQSEPVLATFRARCKQQQADLTVLDAIEAPASLPLYQQRNFSLARAVIESVAERLDLTLSPKQQAVAAQTYIPGRFQIVGPHILLDVAHNPQELRALCQSIEAQYTDASVVALVAFAAGRGRVVAEQLIELAPIVDHLIITGLSSSHSMVPPEEVAASCKAGCISSFEVIPDPLEAYAALQQRTERLQLITGSTYLIEALLPEIDA